MSAWSDDKIAILEADWKAGLSAAQIARKLGPLFSRNAVIGKIHRLGLTSPNTKQHVVRTTLARSPHIKPAIEYVPRVLDQPPPEAIGPWDDFPAVGCRYIDQHPAIQTWRCCGQPGHTRLRKGSTEPETLSFCKYHWALVHKPSLPPRIYADKRWGDFPTDDIAEAPEGIGSYGSYGRGAIHTKKRAA
jgi:hypothetical protein